MRKRLRKRRSPRAAPDDTDRAQLQSRFPAYTLSELSTQFRCLLRRSRFDARSGRFCRVRIERPSRPDRRIEPVDQTPRQALSPGPGNHSAVICTQLQWWGVKRKSEVFGDADKGRSQNFVRSDAPGDNKRSGTALGYQGKHRAHGQTNAIRDAVTDRFLESRRRDRRHRNPKVAQCALRRAVRPSSNRQTRSAVLRVPPSDAEDEPGRIAAESRHFDGRTAGHR